MSNHPAQERVARNDRLIIEAAASVLAEEGWSGLALSRVARRAGLSVTPVRDRYPDQIALAAAAWEQVLAPTWASGMSALIDAADAADPQDLERALEPFVAPAPELRASGELFMVGAHDAQVRALVTDLALAPLERSLNPALAGGPERAAIRGYVVMLALGFLLESWRSHAPEVDFTVPLGDLASALRNPAAPQPLPPERATHLDEGPRIDTGDPLWDAVLRATLRQIGTYGYEAATTEAIVSEAGCSESVLFRRYATKAEAFLDATRRMTAEATQLNVEYQQRMMEKHSPGIAEAIMMREFMRPGREVERGIGLEQFRLAWHDEQLASDIEAEQAAVVTGYLESVAHLPVGEALARLRIEFAMGMGTVMLAQLIPESWQLPYDVVTVPLIDGRT